MNLVNGTRFDAGFTVSTDKAGYEWLVLVVKASYAIPLDPRTLPKPLDEQVSLVMTDEFTGEPGFSAPLRENDFAHRKSRCDVILNGSCYAPGGGPATNVPVGLRVGAMTKSFRVVGPRVWRLGVLSVAPGEPGPFKVLKLSYDVAFGGVDRPEDDPDRQTWFPWNHAGVGYHRRSRPETLVGLPLPNTEELHDPVLRPDGEYRPMAFGPVGRSWRQRIAWAGTYDQRWLDHRSPFLPDDFDERYFQSAPEEQQTEFLRGLEEVVLVNLTPQQRTSFLLPGLRPRFEVFHKNQDWTRLYGVTDTLVIEPDLGRFTMTARASLRLRRNAHEIRTVVVGDMPTDWYPAYGLLRGPRGKRRFESLAHLAAWNRLQRARG